MKTLNLFGSIMSREDSLEYEVMERQLAVKGPESHSWAVHVRGLLKKYDLPSPLPLLYSTPSKDVWKKCVKAKIHNHWHEQLRNEAKSKSTLDKLNTDECQFKKTHHIWNMRSTDPLCVQRAVVHAQMLIQRYPVNSSHTSKQKAQPCPACKDPDETLKHFLTECPGYSTIRTGFTKSITAEMKHTDIDINNDNLLQAILDPSSLTKDPDTCSKLTEIGQSLCYALHRRRATLNDTTVPRNLSTTEVKRRGNLLTFREPRVAKGAPKAPNAATAPRSASQKDGT